MPFTSPLGPLHLAHPSTLSTLLSVFRLNKKKNESNDDKMKTNHPDIQSYSNHVVSSESSSHLIAVPAITRATAPPAYIEDEGLKGEVKTIIQGECGGEQIQLEEIEQMRLARKRQQLIEDDVRISNTLRSMGL